MLWPGTLNQAHTGPEKCSLGPLGMKFSSYLYSSWRVLLGAVTVLGPVRPGYELYIPGGGAYEFPPASLIVGSIPTPETNFSAGDPYTWAVAPDLGVASHMDYLNQQTVVVFSHSKDWERQLRDAGGNSLVITTGGKLPIARTVCSERTTISGPLSKLNIPFLGELQFWRKRAAYGTGAVSELDFAGLSMTDWDALKVNTSETLQSRAKWLPLLPTLGSGTAMMVHLVQSPAVTYAYACVIDARWATGQTMHSDGSIMWSWDSQPGVQEFNRYSSPRDWSFKRASMFDSRYTPYYSKPMKVEQRWLQALTTAMPEASLPGNDLVMTSFEALLNQSGLPKADQPESQVGTVLLEYVLLFLPCLTWKYLWLLLGKIAPVFVDI
jgi:hypothetical protein